MLFFVSFMLVLHKLCNEMQRFSQSALAQGYEIDSILVSAYSLIVDEKVKQYCCLYDPRLISGKLWVLFFFVLRLWSD